MFHSTFTIGFLPTSFHFLPILLLMHHFFIYPYSFISSYYASCKYFLKNPRAHSTVKHPLSVELKGFSKYTSSRTMLKICSLLEETPCWRSKPRRVSICASTQPAWLFFAKKWWNERCCSFRCSNIWQLQISRFFLPFYRATKFYWYIKWGDVRWILFFALIRRYLWTIMPTVPLEEVPAWRSVTVQPRRLGQRMNQFSWLKKASLCQGRCFLSMLSQRLRCWSSFSSSLTKNIHCAIWNSSI